MARYDKYDPKSGGFRARLAAGWDSADVGVVRAVTLDGNGRVVKVTAADTASGVLVIDTPKSAGDPVDVMTAGEIVEVSGLTAGTAYYTAANATLDTAAPAAGVNKVRVGLTAEADRLIVRVQKVQG
jgi:hypothetical protein